MNSCLSGIIATTKELVALDLMLTQAVLLYQKQARSQ
jgi:hypothetical protein